MQYFGARSRAYDTDVIQLFKALADFTQPIELQKTLVYLRMQKMRYRNPCLM